MWKVNAQTLSNLSGGGDFFSSLLPFLHTGEMLQALIKKKKCGLMEFINLDFMLPSGRGTCCVISLSHPFPA